MLAEAKQDPELMSYLPDEKELHLLPRQWLANVIYTRLGETFKAWVDHHVKERHEKYVQRHNVLIDMDPEIAAAFNQSSMVSSKYAELTTVLVQRQTGRACTCSRSARSGDGLKPSSPS